MKLAPLPDADEATARLGLASAAGHIVPGDGYERARAQFGRTMI
jgi:hypothetical protein